MGSIQYNYDRRIKTLLQLTIAEEEVNTFSEAITFHLNKIADKRGLR